MTDPMTCERIDLLIGLTEDALDPDERGPVEGHLESCAACQEVVAGYRETATALRHLERPEPSAEATDRAYAAMMALMEAEQAESAAPTAPAAPSGEPEATERTPRPLGRLIPFFRVVAAAACLMLVLMLVLDERQRSGVADLRKVAPNEEESEAKEGETTLAPAPTDPSQAGSAQLAEPERQESADQVGGRGANRGKPSEVRAREELAPPSLGARTNTKRQPARPGAARQADASKAKGRKEERTQFGAEEKGSAFSEPKQPRSTPAPGAGAAPGATPGAGAPSADPKADAPKRVARRFRAPEPAGRPAPAKPSAKTTAMDGAAGAKRAKRGLSGKAPQVEGAWLVKTNGSSRVFVLRGDRLVSRSVPTVTARRGRRAKARKAAVQQKKRPATVTAAPVPRRSWGRTSGLVREGQPAEPSRDREALLAILSGELRGRWGADPRNAYLKKRSLRGAPEGDSAREQALGEGGGTQGAAKGKPRAASGPTPADDAAPTAGKGGAEPELAKTDARRPLPAATLARVRAVFRVLGVTLPPQPTRAELLSALERLQTAKPKAKSSE